MMLGGGTSVVFDGIFHTPVDAVDDRTLGGVKKQLPARKMREI